jgi:hypothetical protein
MTCTSVHHLVENAKDIMDILKDIATIAGLLLAGLWAWSRFVLERGIIPPSQLRLNARTIGRSGQALIVQIEIEITNKGSSNLIVTDMRIRLRHLRRSDPVNVGGGVDPAKVASGVDPVKKADGVEESIYGRLIFPHASVLGIKSVLKRVRPDKSKTYTNVDIKEIPEEDRLGTGEFQVLPYDTFVQPEVTQLYTFITALPEDAEYLLARASFRYEVKPKWLQAQILELSRSLGLLQYRLRHVKEPHTVEAVFPLTPQQQRGAPE